MTVKEILQRMEFGIAFKRWPIASIISVITSVLLLTWVYQEDLSDQDTSTYLRITLSLYSGFLVSIITPLLVGKSLKKSTLLYVSAISAALAGVSWYLILPGDISASNHETYWVGYAYPMHVVILHLLISFAAFWGHKASENGFLNWNVKLLRIVFEGILFFAVLMLGLSLALLALEHLFGFDIDEKPYLYLIVLLLGVFHPWFVLSKTNTNPHEEAPNETTAGFRILIQYVLIPIAVLYMIILYLYGAKIGIEGSLPQGWLGKLSLGFCSVSLLSFVLNSQLREKSNKKISHLFHRWLPIVLILPICLLLIALGRRILDYGITENRYFVTGLAVWLLIISIAYAIKKELSIKWIPISLTGLLVFQLISGPLNIFNSSIKSQEKRLEIGLQNAGILKGGLISKRANQDPESIDLSSLRYLSTRIRLEDIPFFNTDNINWEQLSVGGNQLSFVIEQLNLEEKIVNNNNNKEYIYFTADLLETFDVSGYNNALPFNTLNFPAIGKVGISEEQSYLSLTLNNNSKYTISASDIHKLYQKEGIGQEKKGLLIRDSLEYLVFINEFSIERNRGDFNITQCSGMLFFNSTE